MTQGGPWKLSTGRDPLTQCGFEVTNTVTRDPAKLLPGTFVMHGILPGRTKA